MITRRVAVERLYLWVTLLDRNWPPIKPREKWNHQVFERRTFKRWPSLLVNLEKMNGLSLSELCYLFCCPPLPSRVAAKLAFLPPEPTYNFEDEQDGSCSLHLTERSEWQYTHRELEGIEVFRTRTRRGNNIACMYVKNSENPKYTILFTHGNAVDLGQMSSFFVGLGSRIDCNIFAFDYSGYGVSTGKPTEKNMYADTEAAWSALRQRYNLSPSQIILYGQSIGTVATVDLATRYEVAGVILHSPLMSGMRVAFPETRRTWCFDPFPKWVLNLKIVDSFSLCQAPFDGRGKFHLTRYNVRFVLEFGNSVLKQKREEGLGVSYKL